MKEDKTVGKRSMKKDKEHNNMEIINTYLTFITINVN